MPPSLNDWPLLYNTLRRFEDRQILPSDVFETIAAELKGTSGRLATVWNTRFTGEVYEELFKAIREGKTVRDFATEAQKILDKYGASEGLNIYSGDRWSASYADTVFRTNMQQAYAAGRYAEMFHPDWMEAEPYWRYSAIEDPRTRPEHAALDGKVFRKDDPIARRYLPPWQFNCLPASALVSGRFSGAFKTWYTGPMIEVTTRRGNRLTVTANHPVLTPGGFVRADNLKEGDHLICNTGRIEDDIDPDRGQVSLARILGTSEDVLLSDNDHVQHGPAKIGQLFETLKVVGSVLHAPCRSNDFYGDSVFGDGEVEVVLLNGELPGRNDSTAGQGFENLGLPLVDKPKPLESGSRLLCLDAQRDFSPFGGSPRGGALPDHGIRVVLEPTPLEGLGLTSTTDWDAKIAESGGQNGAIDPGRPAELQDGLPREISGGEARHVSYAGSMDPVANPGEFSPGQSLDSVFVEDSLGANLANAEPFRQAVDPTSSQVGLDQVVFVKRFWFSGHVYDLQSPYGWILAQNIYISNCRCQAIPLTEDDIRQDGLTVASGADVKNIPMTDAHGNPILGKDGQPQLVGLPPKGWDADRVESLVPGTLRQQRTQTVGPGPGTPPPASGSPVVQAPGPTSHPSALPLTKDQELVSARDLAGLKAWGQKHYPGVNWDLHSTVNGYGFDVETIRRTMAEYDRLAQDWPEVAGRLEYVGATPPQYTGYFKTPKKWASTYAFATRDGKAIGLNPNWYKDLQRMESALKADVMSGYHPAKCASIESMFDHEFGHMIENWMTSGDIPFAEAVGMDGAGLTRDTLGLLRLHSKKSKKLSKYSLENDRETFAEAFAALRADPQGAAALAPIVKRIRFLLDEIMAARAAGRLGKPGDPIPFLSTFPTNIRGAMAVVIDRIRKGVGVK